MPLRCVPALLMLPWLAGFAVADEIPDFPAEHIATFEADVAGLLEANCLKCHSGAEPRGGLDLTRRDAILAGGESGAAVNLANPAESLLIKAINYDGYEMPPTGQMSAKQIESLTNWVKNGLAWPKDLKALHFEAPREPPRVNAERAASAAPAKPVRVSIRRSMPGGSPRDPHFLAERRAPFCADSRPLDRDV